MLTTKKQQQHFFLKSLVPFFCSQIKFNCLRATKELISITKLHL